MLPQLRWQGLTPLWGGSGAGIVAGIFKTWVGWYMGVLMGVWRAM